MISIIIPLYNKEASIAESLQSILDQDYNDYEIIVVNDGSTDNSEDIVRSLNDKRIFLINQENGGPSKARNTGIKNARGEWLYFIDADDNMEPGALSHFAKLSQVHTDIDMFLGEVYFNYSGDKSIIYKYTEGLVKNIFRTHFLDLQCQCSGSSMYRRNVCLNYLYNESIRRFEDLECLFRRYRKCSLYRTDYPVATINVDYASASLGRKDISEDFVGHISFSGKSFWEKMCLYKLYLEERPHYPGQIEKLFPLLKYRYDLLLLTKIFRWLHS